MYIILDVTYSRHKKCIFSPDKSVESVLKYTKLTEYVCQGNIIEKLVPTVVLTYAKFGCSVFMSKEFIAVTNDSIKSG